MSRRQLPLIRPHAAAERSADHASARVLLDQRWLVVVCEAGLDVAAPWVTSLLESLLREACDAELVIDSQVAPISAGARALIARARPWIPDAPAAPASDARVRLLVSDRGRDYVGARGLLFLADRLPSRVPATAPANSAFLRPDRVRGATEIGRELARSLRVAM